MTRIVGSFATWVALSLPAVASQGPGAGAGSAGPFAVLAAATLVAAMGAVVAYGLLRMVRRWSNTWPTPSA